MKASELTPNGIDKFLDGETVILQVIDAKIISKDEDDQKFILTQLSDGFASISKCFFTSEHFPDLNPVNKIIKVRLAEIDGDVKAKILQNKGKKNKVISVDRPQGTFQIIYSHLTEKIGQPIEYRTFVSKNMQNPQGSRKIPLPKKPPTKKAIFPSEEDNSQQQLNTAIEQLKRKNKATKKESISENSRSFQNSRNQSSSVRNPRAPRNKSSKPIEKIQEENRRSIKPEISHFSEEHTKIRELFLGIQNFSLCMRTLFIFPLKSYINKKGTQSELLNIQFGDSSGTIMCTIFGQAISKFANITVDQVYVVEGATVSQHTYKGLKEMKLTFNDKSTSLKKIKENEAQIPDITHFGISIKKLNEESVVGRTYSVVCYLKQNEKQSFVSKKGANTVKKILRLFDLDNHLYIDATVFNENAENEYLQGMYIVRGIQVEEYQGNKQYKGGYQFQYRRLNLPKIKNIKNIDQLNFVNVSSNQKNRRSTVSSFLELQQKCNQIEGKQSLWSEVVCYLKGVRYGSNSKTTYISCPFCRKKVEENDTDCIHCGKNFDHPQPRYILNINLIDDHSNIWASSYDDTGSLILAQPDEQNFGAERFVMLNEEALRQKINNLRYKRMKLKIVSQYQQYKGQRRLKHKVHKVMPFSAAQECASMLHKIKKMMESM